MREPKIGDILEIPLADGRYIYGQYVYWDGRKPAGMGSLVRIFNFFAKRSAEKEVLDNELSSSPLLFPPVFVGLGAAIKSGRWRIVGHIPITDFEFPKFRSTFGTKPGKYHDWRIWDGARTIFVGDLPSEYKNLELKIVWGAEGLEDRILHGQYWGDQLY